MQYIISFLEGVITFISPCLLPMLPIYISYFAGGGERTIKKTLKCAIGFTFGFTAVFTTMGALAGTLGSFLANHQSIVNAVCGLVVIFFGLSYLGVFNINIFRGSRHEIKSKDMCFLSALAFGSIFSIGWTPCVGAFLGSALMMASTSGQTFSGILMLLSYSLGLGIPFILSALLIDQLKGAFDWIKKNYTLINSVCGIFLIVVGISMATGTLGKLIALLS